MWARAALAAVMGVFFLAPGFFPENLEEKRRHGGIRSEYLGIFENENLATFVNMPDWSVFKNISIFDAPPDEKPRPIIYYRLCIFARDAQHRPSVSAQRMPQNVS